MAENSVKKTAAKSNVVVLDFEGHEYHFRREDGWFNATLAASRFGKEPAQWLRLPETVAYLAAIERKYGKISHYTTRRGKNGGTWMHPRLGVPFARWLDVDFSLWCDEQVTRILHGEWKHLRHAAASSYKVMSGVLQLTRREQGKETAPHHYSNEARLVNWALTGEFKGIQRDELSEGDLALLARLEEYNSVLIGHGADYVDRKPLLQKFAADRHLRLAA